MTELDAQQEFVAKPGPAVKSDPAAKRRRMSPRRPTFVGGWPLVAMTSLAIFLLTFAWIAARVRAGEDPVLGKYANGVQAPSKKIKRVVVVRKVIVTELPAKPAQPVAAGGYSAPASTPSYSAPAYSAPAYTPPPAPVSRGS